MANYIGKPWIKNESSSNETPPLSEILNKYFSSISNLNDENKILSDFDCRCLNVLSDIEVC